MGSRNILILGGRYANAKYANSICCQNLAEYFASQGHHAFMVASGYEYSGEEELINGVHVTKIYGDRFGDIINQYSKRTGIIDRLLFRTHQIIYYIKSILFFPLSSYRDSNRILHQAKKIIDNYKIDIVVGMYRPYGATRAAVKLKKEYGNSIKVVTYHLDLYSDYKNKTSFVKSYKIKRMNAIFKKELSIVNRVLLPSSARLIESPKVEYVDFPLYVTHSSVKKDSNDKIWFDSNIINIAILGSLDKDNRNPKYICDIIDNISTINGKTVLLHIWGKLIGLSLERYKNTIYHGIADAKDVPDILSHSDFLLNVGNKVTYNMIPSKIFQMFAAKKPIIFCVSSKEDKSLVFFEKYGHTCVIREYEHKKDDDIKEVETFMTMNFHKALMVDDDLFEKSTPQYIGNKILEG